MQKLKILKSARYIVGTLKVVFTFQNSNKSPIKIVQEPNLVNLQFLLRRALRDSCSTLCDSCSALCDLHGARRW